MKAHAHTSALTSSERSRTSRSAIGDTAQRFSLGPTVDVRRTKTRTDRGFTMVELMIALAVGAILITMAVPSFQTMIQNNRLVTTTNLLVSDIALARSEAAKRSVPVILCNSNDPLTATPACDGTAKVWTTGWFVFADNDRDSAFNSANDTLLRRTQAPGSNIEIRTDTAADDDLQFNTDGSSENGVLATFALCDDRGASEGRQIEINIVGRPALTRPAATCTP